MALNLFVISVLTVLASLAGAQLSSTAPDISDGVCNFPSTVALNTNVLDLYNPLKNYFIPQGSKAFYRGEFEMLNGGQFATTEDEVSALQSRAKFLTLNVLTRVGDLEVNFHGGHQDWLGYRCLPSNLLAVSLRNPLSPLLNVTCTLAGGANGNGSGIATATQAGNIYYQVIWSDATAVTIWGCIHDQKNFHILSTNPELTPDQISANDALLTSLGFNSANFMDMKYN